VPSVLICAPDPSSDLLHGTLLWRRDIDRQLAASDAEGLARARAVRPDLVLIDLALPGALDLVRALRARQQTRGASIAVLAQGALEPTELELVQAGVDAILRAPVSAAWDERLGRLLKVERRREPRLRMRLECQAREDAASTLVCSTADVSKSGLLLESHGPLRIGGDVDITLFLPGSRQPLTGRGQVVREAGPGLYGIKLHGLDGHGAERLLAFVAAACPAD
jgi:CheY-like chemotaxis protein